jgi:hypothetical protein
MARLDPRELAALADRVWDEPFFSRTFKGPDRTLTRDEVRDAVADAVMREMDDDRDTPHRQ